MSLNSLFFVTFCKTTRGTRPCPSHASASPRPLFLIPRLWGCSLGVIRKVLRKTARGYLSWNRSLSLDPWLRYSPVRSILRRSTDLTVGRVLDVGSGTAGLASSLAVPTVALDVAFPGTGPASRKSLTERVKASATHLPFRNSSFGAVVSIDMIEHLALDDRPNALRELFRVAEKLVILGFPFGNRSARFDREALEVEHSRGLSTGWREEHAAHGIPRDAEHAEVLAAATSFHPKARVVWHGHEGIWGLRTRWKLQFSIPKGSPIYGLAFYPLYWFHRLGRRRNAYRRIYVARL